MRTVVVAVDCIIVAFLLSDFLLDERASLEDEMDVPIGLALGILCLNLLGLVSFGGTSRLLSYVKRKKRV